MVFSNYTKLRILSLNWQGFQVSAIVEHLVLEDGMSVKTRNLHVSKTFYCMENNYQSTRVRVSLKDYLKYSK